MGQEESCPINCVDEWVNAVLSKVKSKATKLSQGFGFPEAQSIFHDKGMNKCLQNLHERFVVTTVDKAGNNIVFICKKKFTMNEFFGSWVQPREALIPVTPRTKSARNQLMMLSSPMLSSIKRLVH